MRVRTPAEKESTHAAISQQPIKVKTASSEQAVPFNVLKTLCQPYPNQSALSSQHIGGWLDLFVDFVLHDSYLVYGEYLFVNLLILQSFCIKLAILLKTGSWIICFLLDSNLSLLKRTQQASDPYVAHFSLV